MLAMPEGGWGDDTPVPRPKKPKKKIAHRGIDQFPRYISRVAPPYEPHDGAGPFTSGRDVKEFRLFSVPPYPEPPERPQEPEIPDVTLCLPVLSVSLTATVDGTVAHTELVQKFHNPSDVIIDAAKHVFPLYDGAVITSFECTIGDERRVRGVVKPKVQARKEYEEAVRDRVAAPALLEEHTPEIFETSLGNIPTNTTVEIKITYVQELKVVMMETEATEGIALTIPMSIAPRYSKSPIEWEPASTIPEEKLDIWIRVIDNGKVSHEGCDEESGHIVDFEGSKPIEYFHVSEKDAAPASYYVWHHESQPPVLRKDFVFVIQMNEGHRIKSRAIACPADDEGLAAMRVNIRPNDLFRNAIIPQSFTGEILFLLDQSVSMDWSNGSPAYGSRHTGGRKIDVMREAMFLALSGIPSTCIFNIISWGSATVGLWGNSQPHTEENIREAKKYVSQIEADMGGTDLLRALEAVVKRRVQERGSTQIIILTDGELEPEESIQFIWKKRQLFGDSIRFFALGIGDEVSHRLVESIAECGGGYSDVVHTTQTPRWHDRLNRLLKSALEPNSWSCDIDLGSGFERKSLIDYKLGRDNPADGGKIPYVQSPFPISSLHPFSFASISFLVDLRHGGELPKTIMITTTTPGAKKKSYELPIEIVTNNDGTIHRLVAKSTLLDLENQIKRGTTETEVTKASAENIGTMYSITSKWTSFVAVSEKEPTQTVEEQKMNHYKALFDEIDIDELLNNVDDDESTSSDSSSGIVYGVSQSPQMNSLDLSPPFSRPSDHYNYGRVLESAKSRPLPQPAFYRPPPPPAQKSQTHSAGNNGGRQLVIEQRTLRSCSFEEDSDEPEDLPLAGSPIARCISVSGPVEPQASDDSGPAGTSQNVSHTLSITGSSSSEDEVLEWRSRERRGSTESQARAKNVDGDVGIPSRQRVFSDNSPITGIFANVPLIPNDSSYEEAERLERTRANTADGVTLHSVPDLPPPTAEDSLVHELRDPSRADTARPCSVESYDSAADTKRASTSACSTPSKPVRRSTPLSEDEDAYFEVGTNQRFRVVGPQQTMPSSRRPPVGEDRQLIAPKVPPPSGEPSLPGWAPQSSARETLPGGPKFPTYRVPPIPSPPPRAPGTYNSDAKNGEAMSATYIPQPSETFLGPDSLAVNAKSPHDHGFPYSGYPVFPCDANTAKPGNVGSWDSNHDSDHEERSQSSFDLPSYQHDPHDPLNWRVAMESQDGQGLFKLPEQTGERLRRHFCRDTTLNVMPKISEFLSDSSISAQEREETCGRLMDTLMMVECYKTHLAQEEDIWDLMMERAWDAMIAVLGLSDREEALEELASLARASMMHSHFMAATGTRDSEKDGDSVDAVICPVCDVVWPTTQRFFCPFDHETDTEIDEFQNWDDFWTHQIQKGHVVCPQEGM
jgi:hypothetical protein